MSISDSRRLVTEVMEAGNSIWRERDSEEKWFSMTTEVIWKMVNVLVSDLRKLC